MIALVIALALILADILTKRKNTPVITRLLCVVIPASQLLAPVILFFRLNPSSYSERSYGVLYLELLSWAAAVLYFSLRLMRTKLGYLSTTEEAPKLCGYALRCNLFTLLTYFVGLLGMIVLLFLFPDAILGALGGVVGLLAAHGLLLFLAFIALLSFVFAPIGLVILALIAVDILGSSLALAITGIATMIILAVPVVLGIRVVQTAAKQDLISGKAKVAFIVFMCLPLANTVTLLVLRRLLKKRTGMST